MSRSRNDEDATAHAKPLIMNAITIRRAETADDYRACQDAQRRAWGIREEGYLIPIATMVGAQLHGGLVLGAFQPNGEAVGLSFAFLGRIDGRLGLYSQLTGVVPGMQGQGLGERLKAAQLEFARAQGLEVIAWAFDPLQAGNAHFNLEKLGATATRFIDNMYGLRSDELNANVPTDRLIVELETEPRPRHHPRAADPLTLPRLLERDVNGQPIRVLQPDPNPLPEFLLEIPVEIGRLRAESPALAESWRQAVGAGFRAAFDAGYEAIGLVRENAGDERRAFYRLVHRRAAATD